jgi:hypothetical protein
MKNFKGMQKYAAGGATIDTTQFMPSMTAETSMLNFDKKRRKRPKPPKGKSEPPPRRNANRGTCTYKGC